METIRTAHNDHALKQVVFSVILDQPVDTDTIKAIDALYPKLRSELPRRMTTQGFLIPLPGAPPGGPMTVPPGFFPPTNITGLTFDRLQTNGDVARGLKVEAHSVSVLVSDYAHWSKTWPEVNQLFDLVLTVCLQKYTATAITAQYVDHILRDGPEPFPTEKVLNPDSPLLSRSVFHHTRPWHQHLGWFTGHTAPVPHELLTQVNLDLLLVPPEMTEHLLQITMVHQAQLQSPVGPALTTGDPSLLETFMHWLHNEDKKLLSSMLTPAMRERIGLD